MVQTLAIRSDTPVIRVIDEPSHNMLRIWMRLAFGSLFIMHNMPDYAYTLKHNRIV